MKFIILQWLLKKNFVTGKLQNLVCICPFWPFKRKKNVVLFFTFENQFGHTNLKNRSEHISGSHRIYKKITASSCRSCLAAVRNVKNYHFSALNVLFVCFFLLDRRKKSVGTTNKSVQSWRHGVPRMVTDSRLKSPFQVNGAASTQETNYLHKV